VREVSIGVRAGDD